MKCPSVFPQTSSIAAVSCALDMGHADKWHRSSAAQPDEHSRDAEGFPVLQWNDEMRWTDDSDVSGRTAF